MSDEPVKKEYKKLKSKNSRLVKYLISVLVLLILFGGGYLILQQTGFIRSFQLAVQIQKQAAMSAEDAKILEQLKKIMALPKDIAPGMAIITDAEKLKKEQPGFFADALNGNRLIVYPDKAIIYDYAANKIINVGPVTVDNKNQTQAKQTQQTKTKN